MKTLFVNLSQACGYFTESIALYEVDDALRNVLTLVCIYILSARVENLNTEQFTSPEGRHFEVCKQTDIGYFLSLPD
jgi:hypothetical protein